MSIGTARDIMRRVKAPRGIFVNYPMGQTFGRPHARRIHLKILTDALHRVPMFKKSGQIIDLPYRWKDRPGISWKKTAERTILQYESEELPPPRAI
ncbi:MAG: hypothetical protein JRJ20_14760 [Deltaproteobacteria bacterium]|nr:hypothetical protein [Deltaproteobacteria bacterium]